jgi:hypothetical protein
MHGEVNIQLRVLTPKNGEKWSASRLGLFNPDEIISGIHWT